jgi:hypothetical protein
MAELQRLDIRLPEGITLEKLPYLASGEGIFDISAKIRAMLHFRLRLVAQLLAYYEKEAPEVTQGAAKGARNAIFEELEYLTPLASVINHMQTLARRVPLPEELIAKMATLEN